MARPVGSLIRRGSHWPMEGRIVIFFLPLHVYDETIRTLKTAVQSARLGREEELGALKRLDQQARQLEAWANAPSFEAVLAEERQASPVYGGRSVFGWETNDARRQRSKANI